MYEHTTNYQLSQILIITSLMRFDLPTGATFIISTTFLHKSLPTFSKNWGGLGISPRDARRFLL